MPGQARHDNTSCTSAQLACFLAFAFLAFFLAVFLLLALVMLLLGAEALSDGMAGVAPDDGVVAVPPEPGEAGVAGVAGVAWAKTPAANSPANKAARILFMSFFPEVEEKPDANAAGQAFNAKVLR